MSETTISRRGFVGGMAAGTAALTLSVSFGCGGGKSVRIANAKKSGVLKANMYVSVLANGRIALAVNKAEIGQGVTTVFATLAAEELAVAVDQIDVYFADSHPEYRTSYTIHQTGGSSSTKEAFVAVRKAAAAAREMLTAAAADSWKVPVSQCLANDGKVAHAQSGRSIGYGDLSVLAAAQDVPEDPKLTAVDKFKLIGKYDRRVDAKSKVDGTAVYGIDVVVPNMVHAAIIHGPQFHARPKSFKADAARGMPGVIDIFAIDEGVVVVADKYWQALAALPKVEVTWNQGATAGLNTEELAAAARQYKGSRSIARDDGSADDAISESAVKVSAVYELPYLAHAPLEPQNCVVSVRGDGAEVWAPCQGPSVMQAFVADRIDCDPRDVLVHTTLAGGGFGRRAVADFGAQAAAISKKVKRPVKLIWSRSSDMTQGFYRPSAVVSMRGGVNSKGKVTGISTHSVSQSITASSSEQLQAFMPGIPRSLQGVMVNSLMGMFATNSMSDLFACEGLQDMAYNVDNVRVAFTPIRTKIPVTTWRAVGHSLNGFALESFIDELAVAAKKDAMTFRHAIVGATSKQKRVLDELATLSQWNAPLPNGRARGLARHFSFETEVGEVAEVEIVNDRIVVRKVYCVVDCGIAVNPGVVKANMEGAIMYGLAAALEQEITMVDGVVQQHNFDTFPSIRMSEAPEVIVKILPSTKDPTGAGEPGLPPIAAAVANAVYALTGVRLRQLPLQTAWKQRGTK